jgi:hypothetical protein
VKVALPSVGRPKRDYLAPQKQDLPFEIHSGLRTHNVARESKGHQMVVFES